MNKKKQVNKFEEFVKSSSPEVFTIKNKEFPVDNIIVGLLKNMLLKNTAYTNEGFEVYDEDFFKVKLDVSGFSEDLISKALKEISFSNQKFYKDGKLFFCQIWGVEYNLCDELVSFNIEKEKLLFLRDSVLNCNK